LKSSSTSFHANSGSLRSIKGVPEKVRRDRRLGRLLRNLPRRRDAGLALAEEGTEFTAFEDLGLQPRAEGRTGTEEVDQQVVVEARQVQLRRSDRGGHGARS